MIQAMSMILDFSRDHWDPSTRLVALALADRVNGDSLECWPSLRDVCRRTGLSERSVQRHLRILEDEGIITNLGQRISKSGTPGSNVWRWNYLIGGDIGGTRGGDTHGTPRGVTPMTPKPLDLTTMNETLQTPPIGFA